MRQYRIYITEQAEDHLSSIKNYYIEQLNSPDMSKNINNNSTLDLFYEKLHLTEREQEIFSLLLEHKSNQEIADQLYLSVGTVKTHVHNIFMKLEITKRNQLFEVYSSFENQHPEL